MDAYFGEIRFFAFIPYGAEQTTPTWHLCDGSWLPIEGNNALFTLLGFVFGGDGKTYFALPDLRGRIPIGMGIDGFGNNYTLGQSGGLDEVTLTPDNVSAHNHTVNASTGTSPFALPNDRFPGSATPTQKIPDPAPIYAPLDNNAVQLVSGTVGSTGGGGGHDNIQPSKVLGYYICTNGLFPTRP